MGRKLLIDIGSCNRAAFLAPSLLALVGLDAVKQLRVTAWRRGLTVSLLGLMME
jgi:hypothetical protein